MALLLNAVNLLSGASESFYVLCGSNSRCQCVRACVRGQHILRTAGPILIIFSPINSILAVVVHLIYIFFVWKKNIIIFLNTKCGFQVFKHFMSSGIYGGCMGFLYSISNAPYPSFCGIGFSRTAGPILIIFHRSTAFWM